VPQSPINLVEHRAFSEKTHFCANELNGRITVIWGFLEVMGLEANLFYIWIRQKPDAV
jgi:hypothetical protein